MSFSLDLGHEKDLGTHIRTEKPLLEDGSRARVVGDGGRRDRDGDLQNVASVIQDALLVRTPLSCLIGVSVGGACGRDRTSTAFDRRR